MSWWQRDGIRLGALSFGGLVAGHLLAYALAAPDPADHAHLLHATGHASWTLPIVCAIGAFLACAIAAAARPTGARDAAGARTLVLQLAALQVTGFLALEVAERAAAGHGLTRVLEEPVVFFGVLLQVLLALVSPLILRAVVALARALRLGRPRASTTSATSVHPLSVASLRLQWLTLGAWNLRGPPHLLMS